MRELMEGQEPSLTNPSAKKKAATELTRLATEFKELAETLS